MIEHRKYASSGPHKREQVERLFGAIAARYDLINDIQSLGFHRFWKRKLIRMAGIEPGEKVLDICSGTGDVAFGLAAQGARAVGFDFSAPMLAVAEKRNTRGNVQFIRGDALQMPFRDESFDCVTISYGLRNLSSVEEGLRELLRVLKRGGKILILEFGKPVDSLVRSLYFFYLRAALPIYGKVFCGNRAAYSYILDSLKAYPGQVEIEKVLQTLGCSNSKVINLIGGTMSINFAEKT
jgi:demethylmenaquinone methyltransferase/2-methoxy-6-polyprenyl-1,4-benzoquinol methylase